MPHESGNKQHAAGIDGLLKLQNHLLGWMLHEDEAIRPHIAGVGENGTEERLRIYSNAYRFRLVDALSDTYPAVHTLLGDEQFYRMSCAYIDAHPSKHFSLRYFGNQLDRFLTEYDSENPVLAEMAEFEWSLRNAFDAEDIQPASLAMLQEIPAEEWGSMRFRFHASVQRLNLEWNTPRLWAAIDAQAEPVAPEKLEYPYAWVLWRKALLTYYRSLDVDEAWALDSAMQGALFADLCAGVCEWVDEANAPARVAGFVARWLEDELLITVC